jgi:hypothetical protein
MAGLVPAIHHYDPSVPDLILRGRVSGVSKEDSVVSGDALPFETLRSSG